jgi:Flp pilus assembly protein TadD
MILAAAIAAAVSAAQPAALPVAAGTPSLSEAALALEAGRLEQARLMISNAMAAGATGFEVDRLLADLAFASGKNDEALARYQQLIAAGAGSTLMAERAGIAALKLGQVDRALPLVTQATESPAATWRAWNARGVIADLQADWTAADLAYERAAALAPDQSQLFNNRGWSQLLRGNWQGAIDQLEQAARLKPVAERTANNLELARAALANGLPERRPGESGSDWARRLNDAGVTARIMGNHTKAVAAFSQALQVSETWYARAANNLEAATASR